MTQKNFSIIIIMFLGAYTLSAQDVKGTVYEENKQGVRTPLPGVNVIWLGTTSGTATDEQGGFSISKPVADAHTLVFSYVGYENDTVHVQGAGELAVVLKAAKELDEVTVTGEQRPSLLATFAPINKITLTEKELKKASCCNLSESFETTATVDVDYADAITGAKVIKLLGLEGAYTQMLTENIPAMRGLGITYGLGYIPGSWLESIQITKGSGSVVNGYESMAGQINVELRKPEDSDRLFLNLYGNHFGRVEGNLNLAHRFSDKWSGMLLLHSNYLGRKVDNNDDGFLDLPLQTQYNVINRWFYSNKKRLEMRFGVKALAEERGGGQMTFDRKKDKGTTNAYGFGISTQRYEAFHKTAVLFPGRPYKSIGLIVNGTFHNQQSFFGLNEYEGRQASIYANLIYQSIISTTMHSFRTGASMMADKFEEKFNGIDYPLEEYVPGVFGEYTFNYIDKFNAVAGLRLDYHNLHGLIATPRLHLRYNPVEKTIIRASAGRGFRTPHIFAENTHVLISSRELVIQEELKPEVSWNFGGSITQMFSIGFREGFINVDFYRTEFVNQVILDWDVHHQIRFYNLDGKSYSNSFLAEVNYEIVEGLLGKAAYRLDDVKTTYNDTLLQRPLVQKHRVFLNLGYTVRNEKWLFDFTTQWHGKSRLPDTQHNPEVYQIDEYSPSYFILHGQVTKKFKKWEVYLGGENLLNYKQKNPIISADNPFSEYFDASMVWGPVSGRNIYAGLRWTL